MHDFFDWDPKKARQNLAKHGVSFQQATEVFLDPFQLSIADEEHSHTEERWITLGKTTNQRLLVVVHTIEQQGSTMAVRIISARRANRHEQRQYENIL